MAAQCRITLRQLSAHPLAFLQPVQSLWMHRWCRGGMRGQTLLSQTMHASLSPAISEKKKLKKKASSALNSFQFVYLDNKIFFK